MGEGDLWASSCLAGQVLRHHTVLMCLSFSFIDVCQRLSFFWHNGNYKKKLSWIVHIILHSCFDFFYLVFVKKNIIWSKYVFFPIIFLKVFLIFLFIGGLDPVHPRWAATQPPTSCGCPSTWHREWPCPHPQLGWGKDWLGYLYVGVLHLLLKFSCVGWNFLLAKIAGRAMSKVCFTLAEWFASFCSLRFCIINDVTSQHQSIHIYILYFRPGDKNSKQASNLSIIWTFS